MQNVLLYYIIYVGKINTFMMNQKVATYWFVGDNFGSVWKEAYSGVTHFLLKTL